MDLSKIVEELKQDFEVITMPRSAYVLEHLVVKVHEHPTQQWLQCVLEMQIKYNNIRRSQIGREIIQCEISSWRNRLLAWLGLRQLKDDLKRIDIEEMELNELGMIREFLALHQIYKQMPRFTREEIEQGQVDYWYNRLTKQAVQDLQASGRVSVGNQEALRQIQVGVKVNSKGEIETIRHLRLNGG